MVTLLWVLSAPAQADTPADSAAGVYVAGGNATWFAFRVDPWTSDLMMVRGVGRAPLATEAPTDVWFEILGTYRPGHNHAIEGLFRCRHGNNLATVPWRGSFDPKAKTFRWAGTAGDRAVALPHAGEVTTTAAPPVSNTPTGRERPSSIEKPDAHAEQGETAASGTSQAVKGLFATKSPDTTGAFADVIAGTNSSPAATPASRPASDSEIADWLIIETLTEMGKGTDPTGENRSDPAGLDPERLIDLATGRTASDDPPVRKRVEYPPLDPPRTLRRLTKPKAPAPSPPAPPASSNESATTLVPNVVGHTFEAAVNELWAVGLNPSSVECLGPAKDPAQGNQVVSQTPPAGAPFPPDRTMRLQWYAPPEREPEAVDGFQPPDGPKVDMRFAESKIVAEGRGIGKSGVSDGETFAWMIVLTGKTPFDQAAQDAVAHLRKRMADAKSTDRVTIDVTLRRDNPGDIAFEYSSHSISNGEEVARTEHHRVFEYRGFVIQYFHGRRGRSQPLAAVADTVLENSRRLIDLRFPKRE